MVPQPGRARSPLNVMAGPKLLMARSGRLALYFEFCIPKELAVRLADAVRHIAGVVRSNAGAKLNLTGAVQRMIPTSMKH